ncbi:Crp/Fnr family transcriptional regulator [Dehalobacter sp. TBBPA1]|uniref:Crp/Fnr family transcriptional regulator n=1 Tax=Dehalobacter sp. TBBPA1 TaxID=3235037 RepID=UPI0034A2DAE9
MGKMMNDHYILPQNFYPMLKLRDYLHLGIIRHYRKGESIVFLGETIDSIILVLSGKLGISFMHENGKQKFMYHADPYTFIDEALGIFTSSYVHVVSEEDSSVCFFEKFQFLMILHENKELLLEYITCFSSKRCYFMHEASEAVLYKPSVRILRFFYLLCNTQGKLVDNVYEIDVKISQRAISEITGVHFITVNKILRYLKKENILNKTRNKIIIYDLPQLKALIEDWMNH